MEKELRLELRFIMYISFCTEEQCLSLFLPEEQLCALSVWSASLASHPCCALVESSHLMTQHVSGGTSFHRSPVSTHRIFHCGPNQSFKSYSPMRKCELNLFFFRFSHEYSTQLQRASWNINLGDWGSPANQKPPNGPVAGWWMALIKRTFRSSTSLSQVPFSSQIYVL